MLCARRAVGRLKHTDQGDAGLATTVLLGATTPIAEILHGLEHLRMPRLMTAIAGSEDAWLLQPSWPMEPEILVLDEPTSNLDPAGRRELAEILKSLDLTMLMVSHDLPYALELCPRSLLMNEGTLVADGRTRDILSDNGLMSANRLELPYGFDPDFVAP